MYLGTLGCAPLAGCHLSDTLLLVARGAWQGGRPGSCSSARAGAGHRHVIDCSATVTSGHGMTAGRMPNPLQSRTVFLTFPAALRYTLARDQWSLLFCAASLPPLETVVQGPVRGGRPGRSRGTAVAAHRHRPLRMQADVAQWAEQRFCKPRVAGSSPTVGSHSQRRSRAPASRSAMPAPGRPTASRVLRSNGSCPTHRT